MTGVGASCTSYCTVPSPEVVRTRERGGGARSGWSGGVHGIVRPPVQATLLDVAGDALGHQVLDGGAGRDPGADVGRGDRERRDLDRVDPAVRRRDAAEQARQVVAGPGGRDQLGEGEHLLGVLPGEDLQDGVGAGDEEQAGPRPEPGVQAAQGVDRVGRPRDVDLEPADRERRVGRGGGHGHEVAVLGGGDPRRLLPGLPGRDEEDLLEPELPARLLGGDEVAVVDRVEGAAHDADPALGALGPVPRPPGARPCPARHRSPAAPAGWPSSPRPRRSVREGAVGRPTGAEGTAGVEGATMAQIVLDRATKVYGGNVTAVDALTLDIADGEFMVFVGPSGCGKSTALRMIAGLEDITSGTVAIGDRVVNDLAPKDRDIAMVFQNYALYPHMTVRDNLAFGLQLRKTPKDEQHKRVGDAARILGLEPYLDRKPAALSGGQRQRVAMGRAIVREPQAYLMDEPLSNLDAKL